MQAITYIVRRLDGDYAHLVDVDTGVELLVARALLPEETDEGSRLLFEEFSYTLL